MPKPGYKPHLTHSRLSRGDTVSLRSACLGRGPVRELIDGNFPDEFIDSVKLAKAGSRWSVTVRYGAHKKTVRDEHLRVRAGGQVHLRWAARLKRVVNDLYVVWLSWRGDVTSEPPAGCPNDAHKAWNPYREEAAFFQDEGHWRCVGCGWLLTSDGERVHEKYLSALFESDRGAKKTRSYRGHE